MKSIVFGEIIMKKKKQKMKKMKSLLLTLSLVVAAFWVSPAVAAEKETVFDPATGRTWTAPEYGGTLTWAARHHPPVIDPWFSAGWAPHFIGGVNEGLAFADWAISRDIWIGGNHRVWNAELHRGLWLKAGQCPTTQRSSGRSARVFTGTIRRR